jgi:hypothetical protein
MFSIRASESQQSWYRNNQSLGVAAVATTSALTASVSWWAYKKYSNAIEPVNLEKLEATEKTLPAIRQIATLNEQLMQSHLLEFGMGAKRSTYFLPQMKAHAALLAGVNLQQAVAPIELHDAKPCPCENTDRWDFSLGKSVRIKEACPAIQEGYGIVQKELMKYVDSQQAVVTKEKQAFERNKSLENKKRLVKIIGAVSGIVSLASLGIYGWSWYKSQKPNK